MTGDNDIFSINPEIFEWTTNRTTLVDNLVGFVDMIARVYSENCCHSIVNFTLCANPVSSKRVFEFIKNFICDHDSIQAFVDSICGERLHSIFSNQLKSIGMCDYSETQQLFNHKVLVYKRTKHPFFLPSEVIATTPIEEKIRDYLLFSNNTIKSFAKSTNKKFKVRYRVIQQSINTTSVNVGDRNQPWVERQTKQISIRIQGEKVISTGRSVIPNCTQIEFLSGTRIMFFINGTIQVITGKKDTGDDHFSTFIRSLFIIFHFILDIRLAVEDAEPNRILALNLRNRLADFILLQNDTSNEYTKDQKDIIEKISDLSPFTHFKSRTINIKYLGIVNSVSFPRSFSHRHTSGKMNFFKGQKCNGIGLSSLAEIEQFLLALKSNIYSTDTIVSKLGLTLRSLITAEEKLALLTKEFALTD